MKFAKVEETGGLVIKAYEPGSILIGEKKYRKNLLLMADRTDEWAVDEAEHLGFEDFNPLLALKPELIILGTGARQVFPPQNTMAQIMGLGIGLEVMDTGAACRTYNILMSEDRNVLAGLIL